MIAALIVTAQIVGYAYLAWLAFGPEPRGQAAASCSDVTADSRPASPAQQTHSTEAAT